MTDKNKLLIVNAQLINEGQIVDADVLIRGDRIEKIAAGISAENGVDVIDIAGKYLMPGMIDDQVHFREPGLTHKGDLATESAAAAAGGITSCMDMPNVNPLTTTGDALRDKYQVAAGRCRSNYGFYMGATNSNVDQIKAMQIGDACGIIAVSRSEENRRRLGRTPASPSKNRLRRSFGQECDRGRLGQGRRRQEHDRRVVGNWFEESGVEGRLDGRRRLRAKYSAPVGRR